MPRGSSSASKLFRVKALPLEKSRDGRWVVSGNGHTKERYIELTTETDIPFEEAVVSRHGDAINIVVFNLRDCWYGVQTDHYKLAPQTLATTIFGLT